MEIDDYMKFFSLFLFIFAYSVFANNIQSIITSPIINNDQTDKILTSSDVDRNNPCASFSMYTSCENIVNEKKVCVKYPLSIEYIINGSNISGSMEFNVVPMTSNIQEISILKNNIDINFQKEIVSVNQIVNYELKYCIYYAGILSSSEASANFYFILGVD